jgi:hypothetical protein
MRSSLLVRAGAAVVALLVPSLAMACPYCATKGADHGTLYFIGSMILLPYVVGVVVIRAIRRLDSDSDDSRSLPDER